VLDVRRRLEWSASHIEGALHVPLHHLPARIPDLPPGPIWVHCQAGYRAGIAASILHAAGREVTAIDDDYQRAALSGLPVVSASLGPYRWFGPRMVGRAENDRKPAYSAKESR
jgi:rhodanese-related sulfurtransferase